MSLTEAQLFSNVGRQFQYKFKAYSKVFISMIMIQLIAILLSLGGNENFGSGDGNVEINAHYYSADLSLILTLLWILLTAIHVTSKAYREDDFVFVTNRISSHLSNVVFLIAASGIGGLTSLFSGYLLKIMLAVSGKHVLFSSGAVGFWDLLIGFFGITFYCILFSAAGYLIGTLIQLHKSFALIIPAFIFGLGLLAGRSPHGKIVLTLIHFFSSESSLLLFILKTAVTAGIFFGVSITIFNRMEVRQ